MRGCVRSYLRITGEILISLGVLVLGFMAYMYWGTAVREGTAQRTFVADLGHQWGSAGPSLADLGSPPSAFPGDIP